MGVSQFARTRVTFQSQIGLEFWERHLTKSGEPHLLGYRTCGQKDEAMTQKRMGQILFGDKSDA